MIRPRRPRRRALRRSRDEGALSGCYQCPSCGEIVRIPIDVGGGARQTFSYDCHVCCRPATLSIVIDGNDVEISAEPES